MSDETVVTQEAPQPTETPTTEPTLDDVYKEAGALTQPEPQREPQAPRQPIIQQPHEPVVPDPYDTAAHRAYLTQLSQGQTVLQNGLAQVAHFLTAQQQAEAKRAMEADVSKAVETMKESAPDMKPKMLEALLDAKAREDTRFKSLWDNRSKNPDAWDKAVKAYGRQMASEFQVKVDPKLQAAQQARKIAQGAMATTATETPDSKWDSMKQDEFASNWERMVNGNSA